MLLLALMSADVMIIETTPSSRSLAGLYTPRKLDDLRKTHSEMLWLESSKQARCKTGRCHWMWLSRFPVLTNVPGPTQCAAITRLLVHQIASGFFKCLLDVYLHRTTIKFYVKCFCSGREVAAHVECPISRFASVVICKKNRNMLISTTTQHSGMIQIVNPCYSTSWLWSCNLYLVIYKM